MSTSTGWALIGLCALVTAAIKATGPVALGGRSLPPWFSRIIQLMAPALLSALVCVSALADGHKLGIGADTVGVGVAGVVLLRGGSVIVGVIVAAVVTAGLRVV